MVAKRNEKVKEELRTAIIQLELHRTASLEGAPGADDEGEVVCSQFGVAVGSVGIGVASRCQDGAALNAGFCSSQRRAMM